MLVAPVTTNLVPVTFPNPSTVATLLPIPPCITRTLSVSAVLPLLNVIPSRVEFVIISGSVLLL